MTLTQKERQQIKTNMATLDYLKGEGIIQAMKRTVTNSKDFYLIVGLGGTGSNALAEVKNALLNKVEKNSVTKYVRFLAIDTARSDVEKLIKETSLTEEETCILPHDNALAKVITPTPFMAKWLNPQLKDHHHGGLEGTGAGNRRQCGRVLLCSDASISLLQSKVSTAFKDLIASNPSPECNLVILAGIAGGTGSGTLIDATYIISQILSSHNNGRNFKASYGFIFLPPASSDDFRASQEKGLVTGNSNGYAALKEIEYHMTLSSRNEKFNMDYENFHVSQGDLFKHCFLIDGHSTIVLNAEPKTVAAKTAADCIVNIIAAEQSQDGVGVAAGGAGGQTGSLLTALSNVSANLEDFIKNNQPQFIPRDTYYRFIATGYSECLVPTDLLTIYAAKKVFDHMYKLYQKYAKADKDEAIKILGEMGLNSQDGLLKRIDSKVNVGFLPNKSRLSAAIYDAEEELQNELEKAFKDKMDILFKRYGPYYLINLTLEIGNVLKGRSIKPAVGSGKVALEQEAIGRIFSYLSKLSLETNSVTWEVFCAVIDELKRVLESTDAVFTETVVNTNGGIRSYSWTPIRTRDSAGLVWLDNIIDEARIDELIKRFEQALLDQRKSWTEFSDEREVNAAAFVRSFVENGFRDILQLNLQDFVAKCYSGNPEAKATLPDDIDEPSQELIDAAAEIAETLHSFGNILAQIRNQARFNSAPKKYVLILPKETKMINSLIENQMKTHIGLSDFETYYSDHAQSFTLFSSHFAFPLEEFTWVADGEKAYAVCSGHDVIGRHMYEAHINWRGLPNLINQDHWHEIDPEYQFKEEKILSDYVNQMLETAKEYGLVSDFNIEHSQHFMKVLDDTSDTNLSNAIVPFVVNNGIVAQDARAVTFYKEEADRLFGLLNKDVKYDLVHLIKELPEGTFIKKKTKPNTMQMQDGQVPRPGYQWIYTGKFLRKMYNTCISLQRTLGVMAELRKLVSENNTGVAEKEIESTRVQLFANYYGCGLIDYNFEEKSWMYKDELDNEAELLSEVELLPWQKTYHYYYMQEKYLALPDELFAYWDEQYKEIIADVTKRKLISERQASMLETLQAVVKEISPLAFIKKIEQAQPDKALPEKLREFYRGAVSQFGG